MIMEGSWFQAIIVRGKKENFYDVDMGIHFHAWDPPSGALHECQPRSPRDALHLAREAHSS